MSKSSTKEKKAEIADEKAEVEITVAENEQNIESGEISVEDKLFALYRLQMIDSQIDRIRIVRGELPLEVQDVEDELEGLVTRINNLNEELISLEKQVTERKNQIIQSKELIKKYEGQQNNVRNNREYDSLTKEIEFQNLEIQLSEKRIKEFSSLIESKKEVIEQVQVNIDDRTEDLKVKKGELDEIINENEKEEENLMMRSTENQSVIDPRLLFAYKRIRKNARNGLAVVRVERDSCGGCFNKIPPQRQLDIRMRKKVIVCEYCGRILVDPQLANEIEGSENQ